MFLVCFFWTPIWFSSELVLEVWFNYWEFELLTYLLISISNKCVNETTIFFQTNNFLLNDFKTKNQITLKAKKKLPDCLNNRQGFFFFLLYFGCTMACMILIPQPWIKTTPSAMEVQRLNCWTTKEVPRPHFLCPSAGSYWLKDPISGSETFCETTGGI